MPAPRRCGNSCATPDKLRLPETEKLFQVAFCLGCRVIPPV
ncbi:hypothetical protein EIKCOROL_01030 [Eikenella corrodens ATCC 23834]|uniref:Uncharacterized protein n=1 Tax=Eikenella corrodens ATCC 23834 TaxID=546274 RepID=C0DUJ8_EIKCO|nr:hypothetical protein EIKCOROL_01030 [Eikenella corrodens ATCC 23834]